MPATFKKKELHLGKCLGDLHTLSEIKPLNNSASVIIRSLNKVFQDAENLESQGDEERAYVMYMKYFNILKQVKTKADYKSRKEYFDTLIGNRNQLQAIDRAEKLSESLKDRYNLKQAEALANKFASLESSNGVNEEKEVAVKEEIISEKDTQAAVEIPKVQSGIIKCISLCDLLRDANTKIILMDVRPKADFIRSHISHTDCVSVPEEILAPGSTVNHIQSKLPEESNAVWLQRKHADHIILLDWKSTFENVTVGSPLRTLKDALFKFDINTIIKSEPLVLEGGYEQWLLFYPTMTTNAHVAKPSDLNKVQPPSPTMTLDFDYPDLDDNVPITTTSSDTSLVKKKPNNSMSTPAEPVSASMPQFDRTLKPSQSKDSVSASNAPSDSGTVSSLNNAESVNALQRGLNGQSTTGTASSLYPNMGAKLADKNTNIYSDKQPQSQRVVNSPKSINLSFKNNLATDFSQSVIDREKKEVEFKEFQLSRDNALKEDQQKVEEVEKQLRDLKLIKKKEEKDVADLMRMKKKLTEELEKEKNKQKMESQWFAAEEAKRLLVLEQARNEEEEKKQRLDDVEKKRLERKREELKELARIQLDEERKKKEAEDKVKLQLEEERRAEKIKETDLAKKKEEEEMYRKAEEEEQMEAEAAERELVRQRYELEQQRKVAEEERRKLKEEAARLKEENRKKEQMDREIMENERLEKEMRRKEELERELENQRKEALVKKTLEEAAREHAQRERDAQEKLKVAEPETSKMVPSNMLPSGWEKRLDCATNRYFYIDHNLGTTHWTPPAVPASAVVIETYTAHLKDAPSVSSSRGLSRSHSSPNIKKQLEEEEELAKRPAPSFDRGSKPIVRTIVPVAKQTAYVVRKRDLNPIYGNVGPALTGLRNLGNTCYMNSTIQCLNNTSPLISYFLNDSYLHDINRENVQGMQGEVVDDFAIVVKALWSQQYRSITPRDLKNTVGKYNPMFAGYQQQDSQEFLTFLLDGLHEGLNEVRKVPDIPEQNNDNLPDELAAPLAWKHHKLLHRSIIVELFQGQLKSTLKCRTCLKTSVTFQAFMFLSLPISTSSRCSLKDCIKEFLKPEMMTGSSKWKCPRCKVERDSDKKIDIWKLPPILMIGLNRFYSEGMWMQKKTTYVDFPVDNLDLSTYIIGQNVRNNYNLYGISNHYGTMEGGHYTAFCRNPVNKKWYKFDDHDAYDMAASDVKTSAAYVLYYTSMDMPAPQYKPHL